MIHHSHCPVCMQGPVHPGFKATDHTVSQETFEVWVCDSCDARFTQDVPGVDDIGKYYASESYVSHSDTRDGLVNKMYHRVRSMTLKHKRKLVQQKTGMLGGRLLDIGAGTGAFAHEMHEAGWEVTALEPDSNARLTAAKLYKINLLPDDAIFSQEGKFDAITLWHVLEHVHRLHEYGEQFKRLLKPGGKLFIAVPNHLSEDAKFYGASWAAWDVPRHLYHFAPQSMRAFLSLHGLNLTSMLPMWFDSFYVSMLSEPYKTGRQHMARAFLKGVQSNFNAVKSVEKCSSVIYVAELA